MVSKSTTFVLSLFLALCLLTTIESASCTYGGGYCLGYYGVCCNTVNPGRCCPIGNYCCGAQVNYGSCPIGYRCGLTTCTRISRSGDGPASVVKTGVKATR